MAHLWWRPDISQQYVTQCHPILHLQVRGTSSQNSQDGKTAASGRNIFAAPPADGPVGGMTVGDAGTQAAIQ